MCVWLEICYGQLVKTRDGKGSKSFKTKQKLCCVSTVLYLCGAVACYSTIILCFCTDSLSLYTNTLEFALKVAIQTELLTLSVVLTKNCESFLTWIPRGDELWENTVVSIKDTAAVNGLSGWCVSVDMTTVLLLSILLYHSWKVELQVLSSVY